MRSSFYLFILFSILLHANGHGACPLADSGIIANGTTITESDCTITTTYGANANAVTALGSNSSIFLNNMDILVTGTNGRGLFALTGGNKICAENCKIETNSSVNGTVVEAQGTGTTILLDHSSVSSIGGAAVGTIVARQGATIDVINGSSITSLQDYSYGVRASDIGSSINCDSSSITTAGNFAFGSYAQFGATIRLNNTSLMTGGHSAHATLIQDGSLMTVHNSSLQTSGIGALGVFLMGSSAGTEVDLCNTSVATSGNEALALYAYANTGITNTVKATNTSFSALDATVFSFNGGTANVILNTVSAIAPPDFLLVEVDGSNPTSLFMTTSESKLIGDLRVVNGNTGNISLGSNTLWEGGAFEVTNLAIETSLWTLTKSSSITNQLSNAGIIDFLSSGNDFKTLTVRGNYNGQNGLLSLNAFLEGDGSPSDLIVIDGGTATGHTYLCIKNTTGEGALTIGNGILVIDAINGGTTGAQSFSLADSVMAGPYEYSLYRGSVDGAETENWYLRSTSNPISPQTPDFRREVSLYTALPTTAMLYGRTLMDTRHQRVGEDQVCGNTIEEKASFFKRSWMRVINRNGRQRNGGIFHHGPDFKFHLLAFQAGADLYQNRCLDNSRDYVGVLGAIGNGRSHVRHIAHVHAGRDCFDAYSAGAYWTHFGASNWYIDSVFLTNWYRNVKAHSSRMSLKTHGIEMAGSVEGGYPLELKYLTLEPQAQLIYQTLSLHDKKEITTKIHFRRTHSVLGRLGLRLAKSWTLGRADSDQFRQCSLWLCANAWHDFDGQSKTFFSTSLGHVGFSSELEGSWIQGTLGITVQLTRILSLYGTLTGDTYLNGREHSYSGIVGLRMGF